MVLVFGFDEIDPVLKVWSCLTALSLAIYASWKETAKKNKYLDMQDARIEAEHMRSIKDGNTSEADISPLSNVASKKVQPISSAPPIRYPDLPIIIEEFNRERSGSMVTS